MVAVVGRPGNLPQVLANQQNANKVQEIAKKAIFAAGACFCASLKDLPGYVWGRITCFYLPALGTAAAFVHVIVCVILKFPKAVKMTFVAFSVYEVGLVFLAAKGKIQRYFHEKHYLPDGIPGLSVGREHLNCRDAEIRVDGIPAATQWDQILAEFDLLNFTDPAHPRYVDPSLRIREGVERRPGVPLRPEDVLGRDVLRGRIVYCTDRVRNRTPDVGTPRADSAEFGPFWDRIQNGIRAVLHALRTKEDYAGMGQFLCDLAQANNGPCGERLSMEVMNAYLLHVAVDDSAGSAQDCLWTLLAQKRHQIYESVLDSLYRGWRVEARDVHYMAKYLSPGAELGVPGTRRLRIGYAGVHPLSDYEQNRIKSEFFSRYSADLIRSTVREKIRTSHTFRETVLNWIKDQRAGWRQAEFNAFSAGLAPQVQAILERPAPDPDLTQYQRFFDLLRDVPPAQVFSDARTDLQGQLRNAQRDLALLPPGDLEGRRQQEQECADLRRQIAELDQWNMETYFASQRVRDRFRDHFGIPDPLANRQARQTMKEAITDPLVRDLVNPVIQAHYPVPVFPAGREARIAQARRAAEAGLQGVVREKIKIAQVNSLLAGVGDPARPEDKKLPAMPHDQIMRAFRERRIAGVLSDHCDRHRGELFLPQCLEADEVTLKSAVLDWYLLANQVFV